MLRKEAIRVLAVAIVKKKNKVLLSPGFDSSKNESFYRLLGGGVEFGETAEEGLRREFKEELQADLENVKLLKVVENIFTYENKRGHEVCFIFEAEFKDKSLYEKEIFKILDSQEEGDVYWVEVSNENKDVVYPAGCGNLIIS